MIKDELLDPKVNLSPIEIDIEPDWTGVWTAEKAEAELQGGSGASGVQVQGAWLVPL